MTVKFIIGYSILVLSWAIFLYFAYSLFRFVVVGRKAEGSRTNAVTASAFISVLVSSGLWYWALHRFVDDPNWYFKERLVMGIGVGLCVIAILLSRFTARRTSIPVVLGALVIALNWIGSIVRD